MIRLMAALLLICTVAVSQERTGPSISPLHPTSVAPLPVPSFSAFGQTQCSDDGEMFFHIGDVLNDPKILGLSKDGSSHRVYEIPADFSRSVAFEGFQVAPDGALHLMVQNESGSIYLFSFARDSNDSSHVRLDVPDNVKISDFAVFPRGTIVISGNYNEHSVEALRGQRFIGTFAASGRLQSELRPNAGSPVDTKAVPFSNIGSQSSIDEAGLLYRIADKDVVVSDETGNLVRTLHLSVPSPESPATHIQVAGRRVAIWFKKMEKNKPIQLILGLYDSLNGNSLAFYRPASDLGNNAVCFSGEQFTFLGVRNGNMELRVADVR